MTDEEAIRLFRRLAATLSCAAEEVEEMCDQMEELSDERAISTRHALSRCRLRRWLEEAILSELTHFGNSLLNGAEDN